MKKIYYLICVALLSVVVFSLVGCNNQKTPNLYDFAEKESKITADIKKSDTLKNMSISTDSTDVSIVSYDLGYSGHSLTKGEEVLCIKYHVVNKTDSQMEVGNLFHSDAYIDGVEIDPFGSDFYGNGKSFTVFNDTKLRAGAETDIYFCYECSVEDSHKIEVDIYDKNEYDEEFDSYFLSDKILETFSFEIK